MTMFLLRVFIIYILIDEFTYGWLFWCTKQDCEVDSWTAWSGCSASCGDGGQQKRKRFVTQEKKCDDGKKCPELKETRPCNQKCCPVNCLYGGWGAWGSCRGCGVNGIQTSSRNISKVQECGGYCNGPFTRTKLCDTGICCPVNCAVTSWGSWGACNAQCEKQGTQARSRRIATNPTCNGQACPTLTSTKPCVGGCCARDCTFSSWTSWSKCSAAQGVCTTNGGSQSRARSIVKRATCGGKCGSTSDTKRCTVQPITCKLSSWGSWSSCRANNGRCGQGSRTRTRNVVTSPVCSAACGKTSEQGSCMHSCCPVNCVYNSWGSWTGCSNQCGQGMQQRTRTIKSQASCNGVACQDSQKKSTKMCTQYIDVDCLLSTWSAWSQCTNGCGKGTQRRTRKVTRPNKCRGQKCGTLTEQKTCYSYRERTNCVVSQWSAFGQCSEKCGQGVKYRQRSIATNAACGGNACPALRESSTCGQTNGGCQQVCSNGICSCRAGYIKSGTKNCIAKDCGNPTLQYCPPGTKSRGSCVYPTINCGWIGTKFPAKCPLSCSTGFTLQGENKLYCESNGRWKASQSYCKRDNEPPTDILLSGSRSVPENTAAGYVVGQLSTVDINKDKFTYKLISDGGCNCFSIANNALKTLRMFNYEATQNKFQVTIQTIDNGLPHLNFTKSFLISITDVNEKPSDILLSHKFIDENSDTDTVVGTLSTVDQDKRQTYKYTILDSGSVYDQLFKIKGNQILTAKSNKNCIQGQRPDKCFINFEKQQRFNIMVNSMDTGNPPMDVDKQIVIQVRDKNDPPYNLTITSSDVKENAPSGTYIGTMQTSEEDAGQVISYSLLDDDQGNFRIDSLGKVYKTKPSDYEAKVAHLITVQAMDNGSPRMKASKQFTINVIDINEPPVKVYLNEKTGTKVINDSLIIPEDMSTRAVVADIVALDGDSVKSVTIQLDNSNMFEITQTTASCTPAPGGQASSAKSKCTTSIRLKKGLNFEVTDEYDLNVRVIDRGHSVVYKFKVQVNDTNDQPTDIGINGKKSVDVLENMMGIRCGKLQTTDEDVDQTFTYTITSNDFNLFEIQGEYLVLKTYSKLDYETKNQYQLTISSSDSGTPSKTVAKQLTINVINDNDPITKVTLTRYTVTENSSPNTVIANIIIEDQDSNTKNQWNHRCVSNGGYLDNKKNQIIVSNDRKINYELVKTFKYTLTCIDGNLQSNWTFDMNVQDVNEAPYAIRLSNNIIKENQPAQTLIGRLSTQDPDNIRQQRQTFTYALQNYQQRFQIKGDLLYAKTSFDYENEKYFDVSFEVKDSGSPVMSFSETLTISIEDVNDKPTDIILSNNKVNENSAQYTNIGNLTTIDSDQGQSYVYRLIDSAGGRFELENNVLRVAQDNKDCLSTGGSFCSLNYEASSSHQITLITTDNGNPSQSLTKTFTIFITDINDSPRRIRISNYTVRENQPIDTLVGTLRAEDEDRNQVSTFTLVGGDTKHFYIDGRAFLKIKANLSDYEAKSKYELMVRVTDNAAIPMQHTEKVVIEILDINEPPTSITLTDNGSSQTFNQSNPHVAENVAMGTIVATINAFDEDLNNKMLNITLDDDSNGVFSVDQQIKCVDSTYLNKKMKLCTTFLRVAKKIDYEVSTSHEVIVRVTDQGGLHRVQKFTVTVLNQNDAPTGLLLNGKTAISINEGPQPASHIIGQLQTIDEDVGQRFTYQITSDPSSIFQIANNKLQIANNKPANFDFESQNSYKVTVQSTDTSNSPKSSSQTFDIRILDINEAPTNIQLSATTVKEISPKDTIIANITVTDPDNMKTVRQKHVCSLSQSTSSAVMIRNNQLIVKENTIDYEQLKIIEVKITCQDNGAPSLSYTQNSTINVVDVNERPINIRLSSNDINENFVGAIGDLFTDDHDNVDGHTPQKFTYQIMDTLSPFAIRNSTLYNKNSFDYEIQKTYKVNIKTTDNGRPPLSLTKEMDIRVIDVNEQPSSVQLSSITVPENSAKGTIIGTLTVMDEDRTSNGAKQQFTHQLIQNPNGLFRINLMNQLEVALDNKLCLKYGGKYCVLNFEDNRFNTIAIRTTDSGNPPLSVDTPFTIEVRDINESPFQLRLSNSYLIENATIGHIIGTFSYKDEDLNQRHNITLTNDDGGRFSVDNQYNLVKAKSTNYETQKKHVITALVTDNGKPSFSVSKAFNIYIQDVNESPTELHITDLNASRSFTKDQPIINENQPANTILGTVQALDQDTVSDLVFSLVDDANGAFRLANKVTCKNITDGKDQHTSCETQIISTTSFNFEEEDKYSVMIKVADHAGLSHLQQFNISIGDVNDRPTNVTVEGEIMVFVKENSVDKMIGELETIDEDIGQQYKYELLDDAGQRFTIKRDRLGGYWLSTTSKIIDYETSSNYTVTVKTIDNGVPALSFQHEISVQVFDINEAPTDIYLSNHTVNENAPTGTIIGDLGVDDPDVGQSHICTLIDSAQNTFELVNKQIRVANNRLLDYERSTIMNVLIECHDDGVPKMSLKKQLSIVVADINEKPTSLVISKNSVAENAVDTYVGTLRAIDADTTDQKFTYTLFRGADFFKLNGARLLTKVALNYEKKNSHLVEIKATDYGGLSVSQNFSIRVEDRNDAPYNIQCTGINGNSTLETLETSKPGTFLGDCSAFDEDSRQMHFFSITSVIATGYNKIMKLSQPKNWFEIEMTNGRIKQVMSQLNHEQYDKFILTIKTFDNAILSLSMEKNFTLYVRNVNQPPTDIVLNNKKVAENSPTNTVISDITIIDPDNKHMDVHGFKCICETLDVDFNDCPLKVNQQNQLYVADTKLVNYEFLPFYNIRINCTEDITKGGYKISRDFRIQIENVNEAPENIQLDPSNIDEHNQIDELVGTIKFKDPDNLNNNKIEKDNITVTSFRSFGAPFKLANPFDIVATQSLDYESMTSYQVEITLTDDGQPPLSTSQNVTITVNDVNDVPSDVTASSITIAESADIGSLVATLTTVDHDKGQQHTYTLLDDAGVLRLSNNNQLVLTKKLVFGVTKDFEIFLESTDNGKPPLSLQKSIKFTVTDSNDKPTDVTSTVNPIPEDETNKFLAANLKVVDPDVSQTHTCQGLGQDKDRLVFQTEASGNISMYVLPKKFNLDYEKNKQVLVGIRCLDNGQPQLSIDTTITLAVQDVNEPPTSIHIDQQTTVKLPENSEPNYIVGSLSSDDPDENQQLTYQLQGNSTKYFKILPNSPVLVVTNLSLNYEAPPGIDHRDVYIKVTDSGTPPLSYQGVLKIIAEDVNEPPSNITLIGAKQVPENTTLGSHFAQLWADNPEGFKQDLTFYIEPPSDVFEIVKTHGPAGHSFVTIKKELNYDTSKKYTLKIRVEDNGQPQLEAYGEINLEILRSDPCIVGNYDCSQEHRECTRKDKNSYKCTCEAGYEDISGTCEPVNECKAMCNNCKDLEYRAACMKDSTSHPPCGPCVNNGTCIDHHNNYTCQCAPGFTGKNCYHNIDDCISNPCQNGTCHDGIQAFTCECNPGFEGKVCNKEINECSEKPCFDQGRQTCTDLVASYKCDCIEGMSGTRCERRACPEDNTCNKKTEECHSHDLTKAEALETTYRCINKEHLSHIEFDTSFAPLQGDAMYTWMVRFEEFVKKEVKVPLAWLQKGGRGQSVVNDAAILKYQDSKKRFKRDLNDTQKTSVYFYGVIGESVVTPVVLLYSMNDTCMLRYSQCPDNVNKFNCRVCGYVNRALNKYDRPVVLQSTGSPEDPLWMDVLPIAGIALCVLILLTLGIFIYRYRKGKKTWNRSRLEDDYTVKHTDARNTIEIMERRSQTWNEGDLDRFNGVINPIYGVDEDEVDENNVVNTSYKYVNPDGTVRVPNDKKSKQDASHMFDNPLFGVGSADFENKMESYDDIDEENTFNGYSNPNFQKPESEL
ncbi:protocadherin Fat 4-like isoform X3 [Clytia hemisphaerica]|uniref:Uncharacterized protein n=1 Tax=Clytia hemisphaerica TaxID=252671 RepID=A0A7M5V273_9CNID